MFNNIVPQRYRFERPETLTVQALNTIFLREGVAVTASTIRDAPGTYPTTPQLVVESVDITHQGPAVRNATLAAALFANSDGELDSSIAEIEPLIGEIPNSIGEVSFTEIQDAFGVEENSNGRYIAIIIFRLVQKGEPY